ncbi:hypothetical protein QYF36_016227 [Acer negundo]|nr:hypothetical protein QYF36_016227 [Acer negundo]
MEKGRNFDANANKMVADGMSYAEAMNDSRPSKKGTERSLKESTKGMTISWAQSYEVEEWLSRTDVGVLRNFGSIESVNKKLDDRCFVYSTTFMGGKNIIEVQRKTDERGGSEETEYSSSGFDSEVGPSVNGLMCRGECSKSRPVGRFVLRGSSLGPNNVDSPRSSYKKEKNKACRNSDRAGEFLSGSGPSGKILAAGKKKGGVEGASQNTSEARNVSSIQVVPKTHMAIEQGINIVVDLRGQETEVAT